MWKASIGRILALGLLATGSLSAPATAIAQGTQYNETDLEFSQDMAARLERVEKQAEKLEEVAVRYRDYQREQATTAGAISAQDDDFGARGSQSRVSSAGLDKYEHIKLKLRSVQRKAKKEREKIASVQGSKNRPDELDRDSIESSVKRMERDIEDLEKELRRR